MILVYNDGGSRILKHYTVRVPENEYPSSCGMFIRYLSIQEGYADMI